jgi:cytosine/adenosine deaminase-related metal-dependent hydrolase
VLLLQTAQTWIARSKHQSVLAHHGRLTPIFAAFLAAGALESCRPGFEVEVGARGTTMGRGGGRGAESARGESAGNGGDDGSFPQGGAPGAPSSLGATAGANGRRVPDGGSTATSEGQDSRETGSTTRGAAGRAGNATRSDAGATGSGAGAAGSAIPTPGSAGPLSSPFVVTTCPDLSPADGCAVEGSGHALVILGDVLTPGAVFTGGAVRIEDGVIRCVGCDCETADATLVTCPDAVIGPGFVNPHDHVAYDGVGPTPLGAERYDHRHDWRLGLRGHTALSYTGGASHAARAAQELRMLLGGVTTMAGGAGEPGLVRNADMPGLGEGLPTAPADSETFPLDDADGLLLASGCSYGKDHAGPDDVARAGAFLAHLGEGVDRDAENELVCALTADYGLVTPTSGAVHAVATTAALAADFGARSALVVWSPRSNVALYGNTAEVPLLLRSGVEVALGTDWLLTGSMNVPRELACAKTWSDVYFDHALDDHALFSMTTTAGARAVGAGDAVGRLAPGMLADLVLVERREREPFSAFVSAEPDASLLVLRGGAPLYGRAALLEALGAGDCDELDVCGARQRACTADSGFTLAELETAASATYPLFTCDDPPNEPTCIPARPGEYDGIPSELDRDGDGVADNDDLCPTVFDPPRPLDGGFQADADADGRGDACDPCPLDPNDTCHDRSGDRDADGVADGRDDCPNATDAAQTDGDGDGRGDACDYCTLENPGASPCPLPIAALRDAAAPEHPPRHALVELGPALVTALRPDSGSSRGFYVEDGIGPYSGLFVYTGSQSPAVEVGDRVTLTGHYDVYYELDELVDATVIVREPFVEVPAPIVVDAAEVGDEGALGAKYDSMLVTVTGAVVVETNPDAPSDYDETGLDGALRLDDLLDPELDNGFAPGTTFSALTGILGYSFGHEKLMPRGPADLAP